MTVLGLSNAKNVWWPGCTPDHRGELTGNVPQCYWRVHGTGSSTRAARSVNEVRHSMYRHISTITLMTTIRHSTKCVACAKKKVWRMVNLGQVRVQFQLTQNMNVCVQAYLCLRCPVVITYHLNIHLLGIIINGFSRFRVTFMPPS